MTLLSENAPVRSQILPSVWAGYTLPRAEIMGERLPSKGEISASDVPQEWMDEMYEVFQNGSSADFYEKYLSRSLSPKNHEEILLEANKVLKGNIRDLTPPANPLIAMTGADIAHNANEYGHHFFQTACFLKENNQLPKECEFIFWYKINPAFYEEKEKFETVQRVLSEPTRKIPHQLAVESFYRWMKTNDSKAYLEQMKKASGLEFILANVGTMPIEYAVRHYLYEHHMAAHRSRQRGRVSGRSVRGERD